MVAISDSDITAQQRLTVKCAKKLCDELESTPLNVGDIWYVKKRSFKK